MGDSSLKKTLNKYLPRIATWAVWIGLVVVLSLFVLHVLEIFKIVNSEIARQSEEWVSAASLFVLTILLERILTLQEAAEQQEDRLKEARDWSREADKRLDDIGALVKASSKFSAYSDAHAFWQKWERMRARFPRIYLIGEPAEQLKTITQQVELLNSEGKHVIVYRSLASSASRTETQGLLDLPGVKQQRLRVYQTDSFEAAFIVIGADAPVEEFEILINYQNPEDGTIAGIDLRGDAAQKVWTCLRPRLIDSVTAEGRNWGAVRINSADEADFLSRIKLQYRDERRDLNEGVPVRGVDAICESMTLYLATTQKTLVVTHIAEGPNIPLLESPSLKNWLEANYLAVKRGVKVTRILMVPREEANNPVLSKVISEMLEHKIEVRHCCLDTVEKNLREDFSIYDGNRLIYIARAGGSWLGAAEARRTESHSKVEDFQEKFDRLLGLSTPA